MYRPTSSGVLAIKLGLMITASLSQGNRNNIVLILMQYIKIIYTA
jgi:hypothetical protein